MTGRERFLTALHNQKPDRLPFQVHSWMRYYLNTYLNGMDQYRHTSFSAWIRSSTTFPG